MSIGKIMANPDINWLSDFITEDPETFQEGLPEPRHEIAGNTDIPKAGDQPKLSSDVKRTSERMEKASGLKAMLGKINTRQELEQFLLEILKSVNVRPGDMHSAMVKAAKKAKEM